MLDNILKWCTTEISLFIDLEGKDLGSPTGDVRLMSIYHRPTCHTYLVAVSVLGETVFNTPGSHNKSLKQVLESRSIIKGFWDARNDSAGLFRCFGIVIDGVEDIQLLICEATHFKEDRSRPRLDVAIGSLCAMSTEVRWRIYDTKAAGKRMWNPDAGGSFEAFSQCPLDLKIIAYCVSDTCFLDELYTLGLQQISAQGLLNVRDLCRQQLKATQEPGYRDWGRDKAENPFWRPGNYNDSSDGEW